jgi:hypothetical protein
MQICNKDCIFNRKFHTPLHSLECLKSSISIGKNWPSQHKNTKIWKWKTLKYVFVFVWRWFSPILILLFSQGTSIYYVTRFFNFSDPFPFCDKKPYKYLWHRSYVLTMVHNKSLTPSPLERYVIYGCPLILENILGYENLYWKSCLILKSLIG